MSIAESTIPASKFSSPSPLGKLPTEIIQIIFECSPPVFYTKDNVVYSPLLVCKHWNGVALNTPSLWTNIKLQVFDLCWPRSHEKIDQWLARSNSLPLNVHIEIFVPCMRWFRRGVFDDRGDEIYVSLNHVFESAGRWSTLVFKTNKGQVWKRLQGKLSRAVQLKSLAVETEIWEDMVRLRSFEGMDAIDFPPEISVLPELQSLTISCDTIVATKAEIESAFDALRYIPRRAGESLTSLHLISISFTHATAQKFFRMVPNLTELTLEDVSSCDEVFPEEHIQADHLLLIHLPKLANLQFIDRGESQWKVFFHSDVLQEAQMTWRQSSPADFYLFLRCLKALPPTLQTLMVFCWDTDREDCVDSARIADAMKHLLNLQGLLIRKASGWMRDIDATHTLRALMMKIEGKDGAWEWMMPNLCVDRCEFDSQIFRSEVRERLLNARGL
jgi:hypothetical protein